jgi:hypothetical protein
LHAIVYDVGAIDLGGKIFSVIGRHFPAHVYLDGQCPIEAAGLVSKRRAQLSSAAIRQYNEAVFASFAALDKV